MPLFGLIRELSTLRMAIALYQGHPVQIHDLLRTMRSMYFIKTHLRMFEGLDAVFGETAMAPSFRSSFVLYLNPLFVRIRRFAPPSRISFL